MPKQPEFIQEWRKKGRWSMGSFLFAKYGSKNAKNLNQIFKNDTKNSKNGILQVRKIKKMTLLIIEEDVCRERRSLWLQDEADLSLYNGEMWYWSILGLRTPRISLHIIYMNNSEHKKVQLVALELRPSVSTWWEQLEVNTRGKKPIHFWEKMKCLMKECCTHQATNKHHNQ